MLPRLAAASCFLFLWVGLALADDKPCTVHDNGKYYDLSKLGAEKDYALTSPSGRNLTLNVCKSLSIDLWEVKVDKEEDVAAVVRKDHSDFALGYVNTELQVRNGNPMLVYQNGSTCPHTDSMQGSLIIRFVCDNTAFSSGRPEFVAQYPTDDEAACAYIVEWKTRHACPTSESTFTGVGGIFLIIFLVLLSLLLLYLLVGVLYRRYVLNLRGRAQLPTLAPAAVRETFRFCRDAVEDVFARRSDPFDRYGSAWSGWRTGGGGGGGGGGYGYDSVPATRDEEEAILGDEDEDEEQPGGGGPHAPPGANPWASAGPPAGMDGRGVIRL